MTPLVSVVCLCFNHRPFVREAVLSVVQQTYQPLQIIIADDGSVDGSREEIRRLKDEYPFLELALRENKIGNCRAFNEALELVNGDFIVDFSTDDVMMPDRIERQVAHFSHLDSKFGVSFTDAIYINADGQVIRQHFEYLFRKRLIKRIPTGDVYQDVLSTYFIPGPTMMIRRSVFETLGGYDEQLAYEDFDFWVRSSREFHYAFLDYVSTRIRKTSGSMSTSWYVPGDAQLHSTYLICRKAQGLNRSAGDHAALIQRVRYEFRQSVASGNFPEAHEFHSLLIELRGMRVLEYLLWIAFRLKIPLAWGRQLYHRIRYS